jgi:hypothetical protein
MVSLNLVDILGQPKLGEVLTIRVQHFSDERAMAQFH